MTLSAMADALVDIYNGKWIGVQMAIVPAEHPAWRERDTMRSQYTELGDQGAASTIKERRRPFLSGVEPQTDGAG